MASFGIDLGTTFSCIAKYDSAFGKVEIMNNSEGHNITPSVVYVENDHNVTVGDKALNRLKGPSAAKVVAFVKRLIAMDDYCEAGDFNRFPMWQGKHLDPTTVSSMILKKLTLNNDNVKNDVKGEPINVVITYPAYFSQASRERTKQAGQMIGLNVIDMIEEPVAAAISYGCGKSHSKETVLVYDLGGGTFDISVLEFDGRGTGKVLAKAGDPRLGGVDWDNQFGYHIWKKYIAENPQSLELTLEDFKNTELQELDKLRKVNAFRQFAQTAKHNLTESEEYDVECDADGTLVTVSRQEFNDVTQVLLQTTLAMTQEVLEEKAVDAAAVSCVLLVGGSSRMPQVKEALARKYPAFKDMIRLEDPDQAVAKGAAIYAATRSGDLKEAGSEIVIQNISSRSYGLRIVKRDKNGAEVEIVSNILPKNSPLPAESSAFFGTHSDQQTVVMLAVYESDSQDHEIELDQARLLSDNAMLRFGRPVPLNTSLRVQFQLDAAGLLKIHADAPDYPVHVDFSLSLNGVMDERQLQAASESMRQA